MTDYARHGDLKTLLRDPSNRTRSLVTPAKQLLFSYQIALGMEYLHSRGVLHRDLAARNILVESDLGLVKIADFGLARNLRDTGDYYYVQQRGAKVPMKWMAPEALFWHKTSKRSDVWAYGVLLWEIWSFGQSPYPTVAIEKLTDALKAGYRMDRPDGCPAALYEIMLKCWQWEPKKRPAFSAIIEFYEAAQHELKEIGQLIEQLNCEAQQQTCERSQLEEAWKKLKQVSQLRIIEPNVKKCFSREKNSRKDKNEFLTLVLMMFKESCSFISYFN